MQRAAVHTPLKFNCGDRWVQLLLCVDCVCGHFFLIDNLATGVMSGKQTKRMDPCVCRLFIIKFEGQVNYGSFIVRYNKVGEEEKIWGKLGKTRVLAGLGCRHAVTSLLGVFTGAIEHTSDHIKLHPVKESHILRSWWRLK